MTQPVLQTVRGKPVANENRISVGWGVFFVFFYFYRCGMSVLSELVVARLTALGDTGQYQASVFTVFEVKQIFAVSEIFDLGRVYSTAITETVGAVFNFFLFGNPILIDIGFQTIAFIGILKFLTAVEGATRRYLALLVLTPSFNIWSSVAAKEALIVFFVGTLSAYLVGLYKNRLKFGILEILSAIGVFIFKSHYVPAVLAIFLFIVVGKQVKQKAALAVGAGLLSLIPLYLFRDKVDAMAFGIAPHFLGYGSSREAYWIEKYDVFLKAPYGMFQGFFGPTLSESLSGPLQMASFMESTFIVAILLIILFRNLHKLPVFSFFVGINSLCWLLFASYPLGILNAGSAVRYRTGHLLLVFLIFAIIFSRDRYVLWRSGNSGHDQPANASPL
jgi:hypothetical protein